VTDLPQPTPISAPLATWDVPSLDGTEISIQALPGEITVIVGANGAGKSALSYWLDVNSRGLSKRLIAHRKLWFPTAGTDLSPAQREQTADHMQNWSGREDSRFVDHADGQRASIVLFDLLAKLNAENAGMVSRYRAGASAQDVLAEFGLPVLDRLNAILRNASLDVELSLTRQQNFDAVNHRSGARYPINRMSDGEKSAVLLAAEVICGPPGRIFIIDEPERHLHRSISAGLVDGTIADRPDCHFVVLTHDLDLAATLSKRPGRTMSLGSCRWDGHTAAGWDLRDVDQDGTLPESARVAILGGRRELLFIEGNDHSLDKRIYEILFPSITMFAAGGCDQVIRAVSGLRGSGDHHWISAYGIVDGDGRDQVEREALVRRGILPLPVSEVENLYFLDAVMRSVSEARSELIGGDADQLHANAREIALDVLCDAQTLDRLAGRLAVAALRRSFVDNIPTKVDEKADPVEMSIPSPYPEIRARLAELAAARDYDALVTALPVRDTRLPSAVATSLGFRGREDYQATVRLRLAKDPALMATTRALLGPLPSS
jgi:ABC-type lipoprotein export system ATPase subunit